MRVVHMHHINAGDFSNQVANFLTRGNAVCATPKVCPGRYARQHRVGLSLEAEPVRLNGEIVSFATETIYRATDGDSWLWPGSVSSLEISAFTQPDADGVDADETHRVSTDLAVGWPLRNVVEVWIIPATARLRGITLDASVYARHKPEVDAVAAEYGVRVHVVPDPPACAKDGGVTVLHRRSYGRTVRARTTPAQRRALSRARRTTKPAAIPSAPEMYVRRRTEADW